MKEKATAGIKLADVARYAGTSASTVSRVLNNQPGISEATRAIVLEALRTIGYNPEATGSVALVRDSRTRIDILICPLAEQKNPMELNYYGAMLKGIRQATDSSKINLKAKRKRFPKAKIPRASCCSRPLLKIYADI